PSRRRCGWRRPAPRRTMPIRRPYGWRRLVLRRCRATCPPRNTPHGRVPLARLVLTGQPFCRHAERLGQFDERVGAGPRPFPTLQVTNPCPQDPGLFGEGLLAPVVCQALTAQTYTKAIEVHADFSGSRRTFHLHVCTHTGTIIS